MNVGPLIEQLLAGQDLTTDQAEEIMRHMISGEAPEAVIGGFLIALKSKGATGRELAAFVRAMREASTPLDHDLPQVVDTCGTGGGAASFNISTATAFIIAAAGGRVAKHGNRGVTSSCGSADVLEALGADMDLPLERKASLLHNVGITFLYAPAHHPAMRHVGAARKALGTRTVFNQLGPLANPAGANRQIIGVYDAALLQPMAEALAELGTDRALVVHGEDGLDEVSPVADTKAWRVWRGHAEPADMTLASLGLEPISADSLRPGETAEENGSILREAISDVSSPRFAAILPSAAIALWMSGFAELPVQGVERARDLVASGDVSRKLDEFIEATRR